MIVPMSDSITLQNPKITVHIRQNARARRMTLRVSNRDGRVGISVPIGTPLMQIENFVTQHRAWLARHGAGQGIAPLDYGHHVHFNGILHELRKGDQRYPVIAGNAIYLSSTQDKIGAHLRALFKKTAHDCLLPMAQVVATRLNRKINGFALRDTSGRWGSCSNQGRLMFSWRLVMAPPQVQRYVAVHEACHLVEMNHSARFWALVEHEMPAYKMQQRWLREQGHILLRYPL